VEDIPTVNFIRKTADYIKQAAAWQKHYDSLAPKAGGLAPDFELKSANDESSVRLSSFKGKRPVVLIFGSYT
jgi:peroxiredoxin